MIGIPYLKNKTMKKGEFALGTFFVDENQFPLIHKFLDNIETKLEFQEFLKQFLSKRDDNR